MKTESFKFLLKKQQNNLFLSLCFLLLLSNVELKSRARDDFPFLNYYYNVPSDKAPSMRTGVQTESLSFDPKNYVSPTYIDLQPVSKSETNEYKDSFFNQNINEIKTSHLSSNQEVYSEKQIRQMFTKTPKIKIDPTMSSENVSLMKELETKTITPKLSKNDSNDIKIVKNFDSISTVPIEKNKIVTSINSKNRIKKLLSEQKKLKSVLNGPKGFRKNNKQAVNNYINLMKKINTFTIKKIKNMSTHLKSFLISLKDEVNDSKKFKN